MHKRFAYVLLALAASASQAATLPPRFPAPAVQSGFNLTFDGHKLLVSPGAAYVNDKLVTIPQVTEININQAPSGRLTLDTLYVTESGTIAVAQGKPAKHAPEPAVPPDNSLPLAHVVAQGSAALSAADILPITRDSTHVYFGDRMANLKALSGSIEKLKNNQPLRIMFWGDSVTAGANASQPQYKFAELTIKMLRERFHNDKIVYKNFGIGGSNACSRIGTLEEDLKGFKPDLVIIEFVNDLRSKPPDLENVYARINELFDKANTEALWVNPFLPTPILWGRLQDAGGAQDFATEAKGPYFQFVRDKAKEYGWAVADCSQRWAHLDQEGLRADLLLEDGIIHPNDRGHHMLAEEVVKCFH
jgi:lysophospholipase L1-like esterase